MTDAAPFRRYEYPGWGAADVEAQQEFCGPQNRLISTGDLDDDAAARDALAKLNPLVQRPTLSLHFIGAKAALLCDDLVLTYLRDDCPDLAWSAWWDLPGGGREGEESAEDCVLREISEEFGIALPPDRLTWRKVWPSMTDPAHPSFFFGARISANEVGSIRFGDEGQYWCMMPILQFLDHARAIPEMQRRARIFHAFTLAG